MPMEDGTKIHKLRQLVTRIKKYKKFSDNYKLSGILSDIISEWEQE